MTRNRGNRAPHWVAAYLRPWWPSAEPTPNSRPGRDILGTPGAAIEIKTGTEWRSAWVRQAAGYATDGEVPILLYLPPGLGEKHVADSMTILPLRVLMPLLVAAGYAPEPLANQIGDPPCPTQPLAHARTGRSPGSTRGPFTPPPRRSPS